MNNKIILHSHAINRAKERFDLDSSSLLKLLDAGLFLWLKGTGNSRDAMRVRYGRLIYMPHRDEYCVVIMEDRKRLAITVLTEEMACKSSWGIGMTATAKLRAKRIALGEEAVHDSSFLRLYAEEQGPLPLWLCARALTREWRTTHARLSKIEVDAEQIDPHQRICTLAPTQLELAMQWLAEKIEAKEIRPYYDLYVSSGSGKQVLVPNRLVGTLRIGRRCIRKPLE